MSGNSGLRYGKTMCLLLGFSYCAGTNGSFISDTHKNPAHQVVDWSAENKIPSPEQHAIHSVAQTVDHTGPRINWGFPSVPEIGSSNQSKKLRAEAQPFTPSAKPGSFPAHPPVSNQMGYFQFRGNPKLNVNHAREALAPHYPVPHHHHYNQQPIYQQAIHQQPVHQQPVHDQPVHQQHAQPHKHPLPPTFLHPPRYEYHRSNVPTEIENAGGNMHVKVDKNDGKMARKYVEISDNKKHPHYKVLPADLHPEHEDHMHVKHPDLNILPDDLYDVYATHVYCPEDTFEENHDVHKTNEVQHNGYSQ